MDRLLYPQAEFLGPGVIDITDPYSGLIVYLIIFLILFHIITYVLMHSEFKKINGYLATLSTAAKKRNSDIQNGHKNGAINGIFGKDNIRP